MNRPDIAREHLTETETRTAVEVGGSKRRSYKKNMRNHENKDVGAPHGDAADRRFEDEDRTVRKGWKKAQKESSDFLLI